MHQSLGNQHFVPFNLWGCFIQRITDEHREELGEVSVSGLALGERGGGAGFCKSKSCAMSPLEQGDRDVLPANHRARYSQGFQELCRE